MCCCRTLLNESSIADHLFTFPQSLAADMGSLSSFAQNILALAFGRTHNLEISIADATSDPSIPRRGIAISILSGQLSRSHNLVRLNMARQRTSSSSGKQTTKTPARAK